MKNQIVLGAGGVIGRGIAKELGQKEGVQVSLFSRHPDKVNSNDNLIAGDLTSLDDVKAAVHGQDIAYITVGLPYDSKVWEKSWPVVMNNCIEACSEANCRLVFFDNIYGYGPVDGEVQEDLAYHPTSRKGGVRAQIADDLLKSVEQGRLKGVIVRAADFIGPGADNSMFQIMVLDKLKAGKKAQWMVNADVPYSMTYTPDSVKGTIEIAHADDTYGQVWHLPTEDEHLSARAWTELLNEQVAESLNTGIQILSPLLLSLVGIFSKPVKELKEMQYEYDRPYRFSSEKFAKRFGWNATPPAEAVKTTWEAL
jgi:nucleoside-diphosphate-sugar epimerase